MRRERSDLDDLAYDLQERKFLGSLLARPRIYFTDYFHARCEMRARENLTWRLASETPGSR
ncbi:putative metal-dependent HD superfamily phosphohydrolase [Paraburkholderia youngii]